MKKISLLAKAKSIIPERRHHQKGYTDDEIELFKALLDEEISPIQLTKALDVPYANCHARVAQFMRWAYGRGILEFAQKRKARTK